MIREVNAQTRIVVDTETRTVRVSIVVPGANGAPNIVLFQQDVTAALSTTDRQRLQYLFTPPSNVS